MKVRAPCTALQEPDTCLLAFGECRFWEANLTNEMGPWGEVLAPARDNHLERWWKGWKGWLPDAQGLRENWKCFQRKTMACAKNLPSESSPRKRPSALETENQHGWLVIIPAGSKTSPLPHLFSITLFSPSRARAQGKSKRRGARSRAARKPMAFSVSITVTLWLVLVEREERI